ncbi:MAG TPA: metalloprotease family protein [Bacteroidales bacterium]|nr:metalloprotease family protein [Bacteroidales bacterium]
MKTSIGNIILDIENQWKQELYGHCAAIFKTCHIPSHDQTHHARVWNYASSLAVSLYFRGYPVDKPFLTKLIICCFFHDTGLSVTLDASHGKASANICKEYFKNIAINGFEEILRAIEFHENKDDKKLSLKKNLLGSLLTIADDLDAFGYTGIYRYAEVYSLRGIDIAEISSSVLINAKARYQRIVKSLPADVLKTDVLYNNYRELGRFFDVSNSDNVTTLVNTIKSNIIANKQQLNSIVESQQAGLFKDLLVKIEEELNKNLDSSNIVCFSKNEITASDGKINSYSLASALILVLFVVCPFSLWYEDVSLKESLFNVAKTVYIWFIPLVIVHEGLHALFLILTNKFNVKALKFGFSKTSLSPYTHYNQVVTKVSYLVSLFAPFVLIGIIPLFISAFTGSGYWFLLSIISIWTCTGDLLAVFLLSKVPNQYFVLDHTERLGFFVIER